MKIEGLKIDFERPFPILDNLRFPTNEGKYNVLKRLISDVTDSKKIRIITGYAGLDQVIAFISNYAVNSEIEIVFGNEPASIGNNKIRPSSTRLSDELRDYWLERGFSPKSNASVLNTINAIKNGRVKTKIHTKKFLHAKAYMTDTSIIFGSSNFSKPGLVTSRELNGRHQVRSEEYDLLSEFIEGCWNSSEEFDAKLLKLLEELQLHATWEEALARSCASVLEGKWATDLLPPILKREMGSLWPHQVQGIAQALTVLETQGAVVIADPTGSGKTKAGAWLFRLAYNRMISRGGENVDSLIPVIVSPSSVANNWFIATDEVSVPRLVLTMNNLSNQRRASTARKIKQIERTNLLAVDEIHNYYSKTSDRTRTLGSNYAESRIFFTATPINRKFSDIIQLMNLLGIADLDSEIVRKMRNLDEKINSPKLEIKNAARNEAKKLVQRFMIRRTRDDLKKIVQNRPVEYSKSGKLANYPSYEPKNYSLGSNNDDEIVEELEELVNQIKGISRLAKIELSKKQKKLGIKEDNYLKSRLNGAIGLAKWQIWKTLDSSKVALYEHIYGTTMAEGEYHLGSSKKSKNIGSIATLRGMKLPIWGLSDELKNNSQTPKWLIDVEEFEKIKQREIEIYENIIKISQRLSNNRRDAKITLVSESLDQGKKVLAFDTCLISLSYFEKILTDEMREVHLFTGSSGGSKKKRAGMAEGLFGLESDLRPRVGLMSDSMSEGINLQGTNVLIHFTEPSTIRIAEQRVGRVDRMDTKFDEISIFWPNRDSISEKMKDHLRERATLVSDVLGSNLKLPGDEDIEEDLNIDELTLSAEEMNEKMLTNKNGLFDAFHDIRNLIGPGNLISQETYDGMRTSEARVVSCVGLVKSEKPWCFAVIQTSKNWAPQWVYLDWTKKDAKKSRGIYTDITEIVNQLKINLVSADDIKPTPKSDEWIETYLEHISKYELELLPMRKRAILKQMTSALAGWRKKVGFQTVEADFFATLQRAANGRSEEKLDLRILSTQWSDFMRIHIEKIGEQRGNSKKAERDYQKNLAENPPEDYDFFKQQFDFNYSESIDSRIVTFIAGIPEIDIRHK